MKSEIIQGTLIRLDLSQFDRDEMMWMISHGILPVTVVQKELVNRGENEWKVLCELRCAN